MEKFPIAFGFPLEELYKTSTGLANFPPAAVWLNLLVTALGARFVLTKGAYVTSFYRSEAVNKAVGGVPNSAHMSGRAVDIGGSEEVLEAVKARCKKFPFFKLVLDEGDHVHLDW